MSVDGRSTDRTGSASAEQLQAAPREGDADCNVLMRRVATGDHGAFEALYLRMAPAVFGFALYVVGDRATAEDVTRNVFTTLWMRAASFDPSRGTARTWAMAISHRLARDAAPHAVAAGARAAIDQQRLAIALVHFGGLTANEVAQALDLTRLIAATEIRDGLRCIGTDAPRTA